MIAHRTFLSWKKLNSFPSWPTRSHSISSARLVMSTEVSSVNAATMIFYAADACGVGEQERINAATRDDSERFWRLHAKPSLAQDRGTGSVGQKRPARRRNATRDACFQLSAAGGA